MAKYNLIGKNFLPPDVISKVTGKAKYAEDFRAEGMLFAKLLRSPMPHAKVLSIDTSEALSMKGVVAIITADDVPKPPAPAEPMLTNEPLYTGEPILAVAAVDEETAMAAIGSIKIKYQPLPFVLDPLESLRPGGPDARSEGNVANPRLKLQTIKWSAKDFAGVEEGRLPMGKPAEEWQYGDIEAGFKKADLIVEESFTTQPLAHHPMEPRSAMAYWQNGKLYLHASSQSMSFNAPGVAKLLGIKTTDLVFISENTGGGFGSKGTGYPQWGIPAVLSKKAGRPVMMRVTRDEEHSYGRARSGFQGYAKFGFRKDGRILAADVYVISSNGPYHGFWDFRNYGTAISIIHQPMAMRWRGIPVLTNSPPRGPQRGPGENQTSMAIEPIIDKAARKLGLDRVAIRLANAPGHDGKYGGKQVALTSSYLPDALKMGSKKFGWDKKVKLSGKRKGSKVTGIGVATAYHGGGSSGFDGLVLIKPDGKLYIHTGVGNLGTFSYAGTARAAAEALGMPWNKCEIVHGSTGRHLPWNCPQVGSQTTFSATRTNHVAAMDAKAKLQEIAARKLGGKPGDYEVDKGRVFQKANTKKGMTFAAAAQEAVKLGGKFSGQELPKNLNPITVEAVSHLAGQGLVGVSKDTLERKPTIPALCVGFAEVEVDLETGLVEIKDYLGFADCGTVLHPQSIATQITGGAVQGFGMALREKHVFDPKFGIPATRGLHTSKLSTYMDVPLNMKWGAVNKPDPYNPVGAKGVGEPPTGAAASAVLCAINDALGGITFNRTPITADMILNHGAKQAQPFKDFTVNV